MIANVRAYRRLTGAIRSIRGGRVRFWRLPLVHGVLLHSRRVVVLSMKRRWNDCF